MAVTKKTIMKEYNGVDYDTIYQQASGANMVDVVPLANGGTGASTATQARNNIGAAPAYQYSTTDLSAGTSPLPTGTLYFVYE